MASWLAVVALVARGDADGAARDVNPAEVAGSDRASPAADPRRPACLPSADARPRSHPLDGTAPPKALADSLLAHLDPGNSPSSRAVPSSPVRPLWTSHSCLALPGHSQRRQIVPVRARQYGLARDSVAVHKADLACEAVPTQTTARDEGRWSLAPDPPCLLRAACQWCMRRRVGAECHWGQLRESVRCGCTCDPGRPMVTVLVMERTVRPSGHD